MSNLLTIKSMTSDEYNQLSYNCGDDNTLYYITDDGSCRIKDEIVSYAIDKAYQKQKILRRNACTGCGAPISAGMENCSYCGIGVLYDLV